MHPASDLLGPFLGNITDSSVKIWVQKTSDIPLSLWLSLHDHPTSTEPIKIAEVQLLPENFSAGCALIAGLHPDTKYYYKLWTDSEQTQLLDLEGLTSEDLYFLTLPSNGYDDQLDFILMSCHNPETSLRDGLDGFAVWSRIPQIIDENNNIRFALLAGDQVYADEIEDKIKKEPDAAKRQQLYLGIYKKFWSNIHYRKVLCKLPAVMMWDDHDITDGWGSREDSFRSKSSTEFRPEWIGLFESARSAFKQMQAMRNPPSLFPDFQGGFDTCFKIGRAGFAIADLRSNRNLRKPQIMSAEQRVALRKWITQNRDAIDVLFFVSTVVFSHGSPQIENGILKYWLYVLDFMKIVARLPLLGKLAAVFMDNVGDLRDDIDDSWGADVNSTEADLILDCLFDTQNPPDGNPVSVVILSGDIHTPGYATLYSSNPVHKLAVIPHITATPVAYKPFSWFGEAIYRHLTKTVKLGHKGTYTSQISHHFCERNIVVLSLREFDEDLQLKVKYYLENYPEPQIMLFDLRRCSHREEIDWPHP